MTRVDQIKTNPSKPEKPLSRLAEIAAEKVTRVVTAGEAFEHDLAPKPSIPEPEKGITETKHPVSVSTVAPVRKAPETSKFTIKRTFRYSKALDSDLKKFVHRYNLDKSENEPELTMEEVGVVMAKDFLASDPSRIIKESRGL